MLQSMQPRLKAELPFLILLFYSGKYVEYTEMHYEIQCYRTRNVLQTVSRPHGGSLFSNVVADVRVIANARFM